MKLLDEFDERIPFVAFVVGFLLVVFSEWLGQTVVARVLQADGMPWIPDRAYRAADVFRWVGALLFVAGLVERLVETIREQRNP